MAESFELAELVRRQAAGERAYLEFLRVPALSAGLYVLPAGGTDPQQPHTEDEVYYVAAGRAQFTAGDRTQPVGPGSLLYVEAHLPHRFHDIEADLQLVVFFAPAEA